MILAAVFAKMPEKIIPGFNGVWTHDLCVIGAMLYHLYYDATH